MPLPRSLGAALGALLIFSNGAALHADDLPSFELLLKDHQFTPSEIHAPAGKPFLIWFTNQGDEADEFDMLFPSVEKVVPAGQRSAVLIRPLRPGRYPFVGEVDPDDEKGFVVSE